MSRISLNIHGQNVPDVGALKTFLARLKPAWVLIMNNLGLCLEIKALLPDTNVIHRAWGTDGDENDHLQYTPGQWVAQKLREVNGADIWCYTTNEPAFGPEVIRWHVEVMKLASAAGLKLVVGNFGVGNPVDVNRDWEQAEALLRLLNQHRDTMVLGLHEYACGVITSGFVGGPPAELQDAQGNVLHPDFIQAEHWPEDTGKIGALWHCGRFRFLVKHCESIGIKPPRMVITEHGFDDVSDIKSWTETLRKTPTFGNAGGNIRGWKTLENQWNDWFGSRGWSAQRAYFEQIKYADEHIYQDSAVEGQLVYCWGHSSDMWAQFDIAEAGELQGLLTPPPDPLPATQGGGTDAIPPNPTSPPDPSPSGRGETAPHPLTPSPSNGEGEPSPLTPLPQGEGERLPTLFPVDWGDWQTAVLMPVNDAVNIRIEPNTQAGILRTVEMPGMEVEYAAGFGGDWMPVAFGGWKGWVHREYAVLLPPPAGLPGEMEQLKARVAQLEGQMVIFAAVYNKLIDGLAQSLYKIKETPPHP